MRALEVFGYKHYLSGPPSRCSGWHVQIDAVVRNLTQHFHLGSDMGCISMDIPWISIEWINIIDVYTWYICGISMDIPDIPSFLKPDFSAGLCCWSHSMHTSG
jgi:hypothetical protein